MRLIASRTEVVSRLIFYPFIVWFIIFISRHHYLDNWQTNLGLAIVVTLAAVVAWSCAFNLRKAAEDFRSDSLRKLRNQQVNLLCHAEYSKEEFEQYSKLRDEIRDMKDGAFAPFSQHPVLKALLVPFGGVGSVYLLELLIKMTP